MVVGDGGGGVERGAGGWGVPGEMEGRWGLGFEGQVAEGRLRT